MGIGGFSRSQIISTVSRRTEQRGSALDLGGEFIIALQDICLESRWWWRRRVNTFSLVAGQAKYDLTDAAGANAPDLQQIAKNGFKIFATGTPQSYVCPEPVFDVDEQDTILATQSQYPPNTPSRFFLQPGAISTLIVDPIPNAANPCAFAYWAIPNYTDDSGDETVPLIPYYLHPLLIKKLEMQVERYALGEGAEKYQAVSAEYENMKSKAQLYRQFADGYVEDLRTHSRQDAVQSTS